jgi:DNA-binding NarL/FixJ family response regulator
MPASKTGVAIIEDQQEIRERLRVLIDGTPGFRCTGAHATVEDAIPAIGQGPPDIVIVDIGLPGMSRIEGIKLLKQSHPELVVLMLTVYEDDRRIFDAISAGARGYLLKTTPPAKLLESLTEAMAGGAPMSPTVARRVLDLFRQFRPPEHADYGLSPHEMRLLKMLVEGHNFPSAAEELGVTVHAISFHIRSIYEKLHVHSKSQAVAKALRHRIVT